MREFSVCDIILINDFEIEQFRSKLYNIHELIYYKNEG